MTRGGQKAPSQRQLRVGEELRHMLANILERGDIRDPDVAAKVVTVTEVSVSPDLRNATVFVVQLGGGDMKPLLGGLKRVAPYFKQQLAKQLTLRTVPSLHFVEDTSFDTAERIERLLAQPEVRRDLIKDGSPKGEDDGA
jgi:ribosome-binding factor A